MEGLKVPINYLTHRSLGWVLVLTRFEQAWDAAGVDTPDLETAHLDNSIAGLIYVLTYYKRNAPNLTRNFHQQIGDFLEAPARVAKTIGLCMCFQPLTEITVHQIPLRVCKSESQIY